ncbi:MAG: hypothetical protein Kow006_11160 [Gammaproteobacteria bacterium]
MPDWGAPGAGVESISRQLDLAKKRLIGCFSVAQGIRALGVIKNVVFPVLAGMRFLLGPALRALTQPTLCVGGRRSGAGWVKRSRPTVFLKV